MINRAPDASIPRPSIARPPVVRDFSRSRSIAHSRLSRAPRFAWDCLWVEIRSACCFAIIDTRSRALSPLCVEKRSPRPAVGRTRTPAAIAAVMAFILNAVGCSSTGPSPSYQQNMIAGAVQGSPAAAPSSIAAEPPILDLCPLPELAPADLRAKPGYFEFAVSAIDANGVPVTNLKRSDFVVHDGSHTSSIAYFRQTTAKTPVSMVIVGDASRTMFNKTVVKSGILSDVRARLVHGAEDINECDEIAVVVGGGDYAPGFDPAAFNLPPALSTVTLLQPFTTDHDTGLIKIWNVLPS